MDLTFFRSTHTKDVNSDLFDVSETEYIRQNLPEDMADFLINEGKCSYDNNFLWTVCPKDYHEMLKNWGLDGDKMFVVMRSSFGCFVYYSNKKYSILNCQTGENSRAAGDLNTLLNGALALDIILEEFFYINQHKSFFEKNEQLNADEMLTFVPALPLGGDEDTSEIEVVKMKDELDNLAQLYNHQTTDE